MASKEECYKSIGGCPQPAQSITGPNPRERDGSNPRERGGGRCMEREGKSARDFPFF